MEHRREHAASLLASRPGDEFCSPLCNAHTHVLATVGPITQPALKGCLYHRFEEHGATLHFEQGRASEELEADHRRHWVAWQAEQRHTCDVAKGDGLARLHSHAPELHLAHRLQDLLDNVIVAD